MDTKKTKTVWEVKVGENWRYTTAEAASMIFCSDREGDLGRVRLSELPVPRAIKNRQRAPRWHWREITPRRVAASRKALQRERDAAPLFAEQIAATQPTIIGRIQAFEQNGESWWNEMRQGWAADWRRARRILESLPDETRADALFAWAVCGCPGTGLYLLTFLQEFHSYPS